MTEEEIAKLTPEERERMEAAEQEALKILNRQMREGRWYPRRHQRFVVMVLFGLAALYFVIVGVSWLISLL